MAISATWKKLTAKLAGDQYLRIAANICDCSPCHPCSICSNMCVAVAWKISPKRSKIYTLFCAVMPNDINWRFILHWNQFLNRLTAGSKYILADVLKFKFVSFVFSAYSHFEMILPVDYNFSLQFCNSHLSLHDSANNTTFSSTCQFIKITFVV